MAFVYILKSLKNNRYYIGSTINLANRLKEHNSGQSKYTKYNLPFKLVFNKKYETISEARKIESILKSYKSKKIIDKIVKEQTIKLRS